MTIYFYKADGLYGCFSNFSLHPIEIDDLYWSTVEHYYQAHKFVGTEDEAAILAIRNAQTPLEAATLGRDRTRRRRSDWEQVKLQIMWRGVLRKFLTHTDIQAILLNTGEELLVEDSPCDYYWGCGKDKTGQNQLGKTLMNVRQEIRRRLAKEPCTLLEP
ncbi:MULTISPECIES: NADAR family protein [unclassified Coleofasciculus]|uniref:NADAR family protein n=1 Tax=unclassified Coleofasciculus TaxID=2692782 RepID=UPI0018802052|nr:MULTISPECIES: NADAR domain-containing protein [unclassified Coleofasciculus]MBE9124629.1 NADAR family protein [Coleofasciculus sp. LEGE 07081]MBE9147593.1 NADAR family protein [Coleofasciculus sp. LEGE 07092]